MLFPKINHTILINNQMKKKNTFWLAILSMAILMFSNNVFGQATSGFNTPPGANQPFGAADYLGWTSGTNAPLVIKNEDNQPIHFYTNAGTNSLNNRKMSIMRRMINGAEVAGVGIHGVNGPVTFPRSLLHLGNDYFTSGIGGWRKWMDAGTFCGQQSDLAFFGIMAFDGDTTDQQPDMNDAVIAWGDNENPGNDGADNLRFIFSSPLTGTAGSASTYNALEVGRFTPIGRMGIGDFSTVNGSNVQPARKLEIYGENLDPLLSADAPQLRLTYTPGTDWSDFETTSPGNLKISTSNSRVGIHIPGTDEPQYSMHIQGNTFCSDEDALHDVLNITATSTQPSYYTLAAKTQPIHAEDDNSEPCFAIYSNEDNPTDRLAVNADGLGFVNFFTIATPTSYRDRAVSYDNVEVDASFPLTYYGTSPNGGSVVMAPDFYEVASGLNDNPSLLTRYKAKLWVESNDQNPGSPVPNLPCIVAENTVNKGRDNSALHQALIARCVGIQDDANHKNYAGDFTALNANINVGVVSLANSSGDDVARNYGGYFVANSGRLSNVGQAAFAQSTSGDNYGGYFVASSGGNFNYGVYASTPTGTCSTGTACNDAAGYFNGALYTTLGPYNTSDAMLKTNIDTLHGYDAYNILNDINVYSYEFDTAVGNTHNMNLAGGTHYGVLAQELEQILPSVVKNFTSPAKMDTSGNFVGQNFPFKAVNYTELIPILIAGYKNQQRQIDTLIQRLNICCPLPAPRNGNQEQGNGMTVELENSKAIILNQNDPNPFAENTTITWNIPEQELKGQTLNAMVLFYDNNGTVLNTVKVNATGEGSLLVYGNKLNSGIYTYSLVVNGKTISTKRMVKTN
jgi:hypothetical protein